MLGKLLKYDMKIIEPIPDCAAHISAVISTWNPHFRPEESLQTIQQKELFWDSLFCFTFWLLQLQTLEPLSSLLFVSTKTCIRTRIFNPYPSGNKRCTPVVQDDFWNHLGYTRYDSDGAVHLYRVATPFVMDVYHEHRTEILTEFGFIGRYADLTFPKILLFLLIFSIIGAFSSCITIYASVVLGQLFSGHRVLGAVVSYFAISTIVSILSFISLAVLGLSTSKDLIGMRTAAGEPFNFVANMAGVRGFSTLLALIVGIILYILTYVLMNKKIDLA